MNAIDAAFEMMQDAGLSAAQLAQRMGRERTYIYTTIGRKHTPRSNILSEIADACGYDLLVRRRIDGYEIPINDYD